MRDPESYLRNISPGASIHRVDCQGDLYRVTKERDNASEATYLVRFLEQTEDFQQLLKVDNLELEEIFYEEETNRWNIQLIWALTPETKLDEETRESLRQNTRFAIRRSVDVDYLSTFLAPLRTAKDKIDQIETTFERGDLIQSILDENLGFLFNKEETTRSERLDILVDNSETRDQDHEIQVTEPRQEIIDNIEMGPQFRQTAKKRSLETDQFTLLYGRNGSGKTSLLEAATLGMVGQIKRDSNRSHHYTGLQVTLVDEEGRERILSNEPEDVADRIAAWYGYRPRGKANRHLEFYRVNYHEAGATTRLIESGPDQNLEQTIRRFIYGEQLWEALDEKGSLVKEARSKIKNLESEIRELEIDLQELKEDREKIENTYSRARTAERKLSPASQSLVSMPDKNEGSSLAGRDDGYEWTEGWAEWSEFLAELQTSMEHLSELQGEPLAVSELYNRLTTENERTTDRINRLEQIKKLESRQADLHQLDRRFSDSPWNTLPAPTALVVTILSAHDFQLSDLQLVLNAATELDDDISADSIADWRASLSERLEAHRGDLIDQRETLEQISDLQARRRDLQEQIRSLTEEYLSVTESVEYCPACYVEESQEAIQHRERPDDIFDEETSVPENLEMKIRKIEDALEVLKRRAWTEVEYDVGVRFNDICNFEQFEELLLLTPDVSTDKPFPKLSPVSVTVLGEELRKLNANREQPVLMKDGLDQAESRVHLRVKTISEEISQFDPTQDDLSPILSEQSERKEALLAGLEILEQHIPDSEWNRQIQVGRDHRVVKNTLEDAYDSPVLTTTLDSISGEIDELENRINEKQNDKEAYLDGIERLKIAFERAGGSEKFTEFVQNHMSVITTLFQAFQRPYEFDDVELEEGTVSVTRRGRNVSEPISRMSSGQRAALALAIFVTNNLAHPRAPPVMLLDEPFAHLDDINTVSFFNLLIEVTMEYERQVLFATANSDIADLLERKIGDESRFQRVSLD